HEAEIARVCSAAVQAIQRVAPFEQASEHKVNPQLGVDETVRVRDAKHVSRGAVDCVEGRPHSKKNGQCEGGPIHLDEVEPGQMILASVYGGWPSSSTHLNHLRL